MTNLLKKKSHNIMDIFHVKTEQSSLDWVYFIYLFCVERRRWILHVLCSYSTCDNLDLLVFTVSATKHR